MYGNVIVTILLIVITFVLVFKMLKTNVWYKILISLIISNLIITILTPMFSLLNILTIDDIHINLSASDYWAIRGQMGDMLAGHFTALAFVGLLISIQQMQQSIQKQDEALRKQDKVIQIQRKEMRLQRNEMKLQRGEMVKANKITDLQIRLIEKQNFEYTFFNMLSLYSQVRESIKIHHEKHNNDNTDVFDIFFTLFYKDFTSELEKSGKKVFTLKESIEEYNKFYNKYHYLLAQHFRVLYRTIKYVHLYEDNYQQIDKSFYIRLLRARLSTVEIFFLFFNGLTKDGKNFKKLIEEYGLLEHLAPLLIFKKFDLSIIKQYKKEAYGQGEFSNEQTLINFLKELENNEE